MPDLLPTEPKTTPLSEDERMEYSEISHSSRHDDTMIYQAASTILPLSFGTVAVATQFPKMVLPLAVLSVVLYVYWLLLATRLSWYTAVRRQRQQELERKAGLNHHVLLNNPPRDLKTLGEKISIRRIRWWGLLILIAAWAATICNIQLSA